MIDKTWSRKWEYICTYPQNSKVMEINVMCTDKQDCNRLTRGSSVYTRRNAKLGVLVKSWSRGYKTFSMVNSVELDFFPAHNC